MRLIDDCVPGTEFGKWEVLGFLRNCKLQRSQIWECKCECGLIAEIPRGNLLSGKSKGCVDCTRATTKPNKRLKIESGDRFGNLIVEDVAGRLKNKTLIYNCLCDCGNRIVARSTRLKDGTTTHCGCNRKKKLNYLLKSQVEDIQEKTLKVSKKSSYIRKTNKVYSSHGFSPKKNPHTLYRCWSRMKERCYNENNSSFGDYGGRGIYVCDTWLDETNGFINFYNWAIENGWEKGLSIDRYPDNNGPYAPWNCRWATDRQQAHNKRNLKKIIHNGKEIYPIKIWSDIKSYANVSYPTFLSRLIKGWSVKDSALIPINRKLNDAK